MVWNLASRSPSQLVRDIGAGVRRPGSAASGITRAIAGVLLLAAGAVVLLPLVLGSRTYLVLETWAVLTGLLVEQLVGNDLRSRRR